MGTASRAADDAEVEVFDQPSLNALRSLARSRCMRLLAARRLP